MIDFNSIKGVPRQLAILMNLAIRNAVGMIGALNVDAATIGKFQIVQLQSAGTRGVLRSDSAGGATKATGPFGVSHGQILVGHRNGWVQCYGESWVQMSLGLNAIAVAAATAINTSAVPGHGDIAAGPGLETIGYLIDGSMYVGTTEENSRVRVMLLPLWLPAGPP